MGEVIENRDDSAGGESPARAGTGSRLVGFLKENKLWWILPLVLLLGLLLLLALLPATGAVPFSYTK